MLKLLPMKAILLPLLFITTLSVYAQTQSAPQVTSVAESSTTIQGGTSTQVTNTGIKVASINLLNLSLSNISTSTYTVSFALLNTGETQAGIYYTFSLVEKDGGVALTKTFNKPLTLEKGKPFQINESFVVPKGISGTYTLRIQALTDKGLLVGVGQVTGIVVKDTELLKLTSCLMDKKRYEINQILSITCLITETKKGSLTTSTGGGYLVHAKVFYNNEPFEQQSILGEIVNNKATLEIKNVNAPGKYSIHMSLEERNKTSIGKELSTLFTVNGMVVSILNLTLDKNIYKQGDDAVSTIALSVKTEGTSTPLTLTTTLTGKEGVCSTLPPQELQERSALQVDIPITKTCTDPNLTVRITNSENKILAEKTIAVKSPVEIVPAQVTSNSRTPLYVGGGIGILLLLVLGEVFVFRKMRQAGVIAVSQVVVEQIPEVISESTLQAMPQPETPIAEVSESIQIPQQ